jgi:hypothetical protein
MMQTRQILIHAARYSAHAFMREPSKSASASFGRSVNPARNEADHFYVCRECRSAVDMRDLAQVLHHEDEGHAPLPVS